MANLFSTDPQDIRFVRSVLRGLGLGGAAYGIHISLFLECTFLLLFRPKDKIRWHLVIFVLANFILGSMQFAAQIKLTDMVVVDGVYFHNYGNAWHLVNHSTAFVSTWMSDTLLIYRLFAFWDGNWKVVAFPSLTLAGSIASGISHLVVGAHLAEAFGSPLLVTLLSSYWALTFSTSVYVTVFIIGRMVFLQRKIDSLLSSSSASQLSWSARISSLFKRRRTKDEGEGFHDTYSDEPGSALRESLRLRSRHICCSVTSVLLESAALFTVSSVIVAGLYAAKNSSLELFWPVWGQMAAISALLIIVRVARGTALTRNAVVEVSNLRL